MVRFELLPCGTNPPHTHPRASELLFLVSGGPLLAGFVDTSGHDGTRPLIYNSRSLIIQRGHQADPYEIEQIMKVGVAE